MTMTRTRPPRLFVNVKDAAWMCNTSESTIRAALQNGSLPAHRIGGSARPSIHVEDLLVWAKSQPLYIPREVPHV